MKQYIKQTLHLTLLIWITLAAVIIATYVVFIGLRAAGVHEDTSLLIALITSIVSTFLCLLQFPGTYLNFKNEKNTLLELVLQKWGVIRQKKAEPTRQLLQSISQLTQALANMQNPRAYVQEDLVKQFIHISENFANQEISLDRLMQYVADFNSIQQKQFQTMVEFNQAVKQLTQVLAEQQQGVEKIVQSQITEQKNLEQLTQILVDQIRAEPNISEGTVLTETKSSSGIETVRFTGQTDVLEQINRYLTDTSWFKQHNETNFWPFFQSTKLSWFMSDPNLSGPQTVAMFLRNVHILFLLTTREMPSSLLGESVLQRDYHEAVEKWMGSVYQSYLEQKQYEQKLNE